MLAIKKYKNRVYAVKCPGTYFVVAYAGHGSLPNSVEELSENLSEWAGLETPVAEDDPLEIVLLNHNLGRQIAVFEGPARHALEAARYDDMEREDGAMVEVAAYKSSLGEHFVVDLDTINLPRDVPITVTLNDRLIWFGTTDS